MLIQRFFLSVAAMAAMSLPQGSISTANAAEKDIVTTAVEAGSFKTFGGSSEGGRTGGNTRAKDRSRSLLRLTKHSPICQAGTVETLLKPENEDHSCPC